jgi:hypothetical protein
MKNYINIPYIKYKKMNSILNDLLIDRFAESKEMKLFYIYSNIPFSGNNPHNKFIKFGELLKNVLITGKMYEDVLDLFSDIQKFVHGIIRLKSIWRYKHAKTYNTEDLYLNPIETRDKNMFVVLQNNTKYVFHLRELIGIVKSSLSNCCHFFPDPLCCKNPYTNIPFDKSILYNLYFAVRWSNYEMPVLFEGYFRKNFNKEKFIISYEEIINEEYLKTYVDNNCLDDIFKHVREMFKEHKMRCMVHNNFPKDKLIDIMKPYLNLFFISQYAMSRIKKTDAFRSLHRKLHLFIDFNPQFGRRKVRMISTNPFSISKKCEYVFDDRYLSFYDDVYEDDFMRSHLENPATPILHTPPSSSSILHVSSSYYEINDDNDDDESSVDSDDEQTIITTVREQEEVDDNFNEESDDQGNDNETQTIFAIEFLNTSDEDEN